MCQDLLVLHKKIIIVKVLKYTQRRNITNCCEQISSNRDLLPSTIDILPNNLFKMLNV